MSVFSGSPYSLPPAVLYSNWPNKRQKQEFITLWAVLKTNLILRDSSEVYLLLYVSVFPLTI